MQTKVTREKALELLKKYNKEEFHILHALTVEGVMRWYAGEMGFGDEADFWILSSSRRNTARKRRSFWPRSMRRTSLSTQW